MKRLLLLCLLAGPTASAQTAAETWIGANAGFETTPLTFGAGAHVTTGRRVGVRLAYDHANEFTILGSDPSTVNAVSLSASTRRRTGRTALSAFAGPAYTWGLGPFESRTDRPTREPYRTVGLAIGGAAVYELVPRFGIGIDISGNMNPVLSTVGVRLGVHIRGR